MNSLKPSQRKDYYDEEPVLYCKSCLSLSIRNIPLQEESDYCGDCGSTNIGECLIDEWESMYKSRFGKEFVTKSIKKHISRHRVGI